MSEAFDRWTHQVVRGDVSLTDVPEPARLRVASDVKADADRFPDLGGSPTVARLIAELRQVEVGLDE